jgi:hypothetical protein
MIVVTTTAGERDHLPTATAWHVDEVGDLHVRKETRGNIATYARCLWVSVVKLDD